MKRITNLIIIAIASLSVLSCGEGNKAEPQVSPTAQFTLTAVEKRQASGFEWTISQDGRTDSVRESTDEMYISPTRSYEITAQSDDPGFGGIQVTADGNYIKAHRSGNGSYTMGSGKDTWVLEYNADGNREGTVTVTVTGGERKVSFPVTCAPEDIPWQGVWVEYQGKERYIPRYDYKYVKGGILGGHNPGQYFVVPNGTYAELTILRPEPENAYRGPDSGLHCFDYYEGYKLVKPASQYNASVLLTCYHKAFVTEHVPENWNQNLYEGTEIRIEILEEEEVQD